MEIQNNLDWNHAWGAAPANIIPRYLMGIRPLEPGFKKVLIRPQPGGLKKASVKMPTIHGAVHVEFENKKGEPFRLKIKVPSGVTPQVEVPPEKKEGAQVEVNGKRVG